MPPFHVLSFALRIIVMHPCLVAGDNSFQDTRVFFILSNELGRNLHTLSLVHNSKLLGNPPCADFPVSQIIMQYGICGSTADIQMCIHFRHRYLSVFSNHGICPVNVVLCVQCWWPTRTTFINNTCSTRFKPFHPLINLSLTHCALSILSQHTMVNIHRFHSFCPKKPHYITLFFDGAILQNSVHVFTLVAVIQLKAEHCNENDWTLQQALSIPRNAPAPLSPGYRII